MLNFAFFHIGEFNLNCYKITRVSHLLLIFHIFFFELSLLIANVCELFKVNSALLMDGLSRVWINQKQTQTRPFNS